MARAFRVRIVGIPDLERRSRRLASRLNENLLQAGITTGLERFNKTASGLAPVGSRDDQSDLANSFALNLVERGPGMIEMAAGPDTFRGFVGTWIEFGTVHHGAQPFMAPAWTAERDNVTKEVATRVSRAVGRSNG